MGKESRLYASCLDFHVSPPLANDCLSIGQNTWLTWEHNIQRTILNIKHTENGRRMTVQAVVKVFERLQNVRTIYENNYASFHLIAHHVFPLRAVHCAIKLNSESCKHGSLVFTTPWSYETYSWVDVTSVNAHEDKIFDRQNIIHFFLDVAKDYKYAKSPRAENLTDCGWRFVQWVKFLR